MQVLRPRRGNSSSHFFAFFARLSLAAVTRGQQSHVLFVGIGNGVMLQRSIRVAGLSLLLILSVSGAITGLPANALAQAQPVSPASAAETYVLGPNDRVRLKVYGEPDIAGEYEVDNNGNVSVPLAGHIRAAGLTTRRLEHAIASALSKGIVRDPRVNVEVALTGPIIFSARSRRVANTPTASA